MTFSEYLAQILPETTIDHIADLRSQLFEAGLIQKLEQQTISTTAAKLFALEWYRNQMLREAAEGSTGTYGKLFEVESRVKWSIYHNQAMALLDFKSRPARIADMHITLDGRRMSIELKTGAGCLSYGATPAEALMNLKKLWESNKLMVWDFKKDGCPIAMRMKDFFQMLENYNGNVETWFILNKNTAGQWAVKLQPLSKKKAAYLENISGEGYDWETVLMTGMLE